LEPEFSGIACRIIAKLRLGNKNFDLAIDRSLLALGGYPRNANAAGATSLNGSTANVLTR
jgi:hypothetical protein